MPDRRSRLERDRTELAARVLSLQRSFDEMVAASRDSNADDEHDPEGATIAFERAQLVAVLRQANADLVEIDAAIRRFDDGSYGSATDAGSLSHPLASTPGLCFPGSPAGYIRNTAHLHRGLS